MPQRANSCPSPKSTPVDAQSMDTSAASPPSSSPSQPISVQRRAQTCPAQCAGQPENERQTASDRQGPPYTTTPQGWEPDLPDFVFASSPGADEWQIAETDDGRAVYSTVGASGEGSVTIEFQKWDW